MRDSGLKVRQVHESILHYVDLFSEEAFRKARLAETRRENLLSRRGKLKVKLEAEEKADLEQLRKMPAGVARKSLKDVREEYERMRMERIEAEQKEAEERMLQHWKINNPEYREVIPSIWCLFTLLFYNLDNCSFYSCNARSDSKWFKKLGVIRR